MFKSGTKRTCRFVRVMSAFRGIAEMAFRAMRSAYDPQPTSTSQRSFARKAPFAPFRHGRLMSWNLARIRGRE